MTQMECPVCKYPQSSVVRTGMDNHSPNTVLRRRECAKCGNRWSTHEKLRDPKQKRIEIRHE